MTSNEAVTETKQHRSVSQYKQMERCPYSYKLARIDGCWQRPAAWLPQGSAVHTVAEVYKKRQLECTDMTREEARELFSEEYSIEVGKYTETTPNFDYWFASGPYQGEQDVERRYLLGLEQVDRFIDWDVKHPEEVIWIAEDGTPGIEIGFDFDLDGVLIRGFIDAVLANGVVRDYKTGNHPGDDFQLGVYKVALEEQFGLSVRSGDYWMGKSGKPTYPFDLSEWTRERVSEKFRELEDAIEAGDFPPKPDPKTCLFCDTATSCQYRAD